MKPLNIVFMGSPDFAVPSLEKLFNTKHRIAAVVSNPDKRRRRNQKPEPTDVKRKAIELALPVIDTEDVTSPDFAETMKQYEPDLFVVVAFRILPVSVLKIPRIGSINLHASLLPKYRGAAPIHWAIINGEKETGCTVFFLDENVDTGEIIGRNKTSIGLHDTTGDLYDRLKHSGAELLAACVDQIAEGSVQRIEQNHAHATPAPKLDKENTRIDFEQDCMSVHNFIRGLNPLPGAWCMYNGQKTTIYQSAPRPRTTIPTGELAVENSKLLVGCGEGAVEVTDIQLPGKKRISGLDFANSYGLDKLFK